MTREDALRRGETKIYWLDVLIGVELALAGVLLYVYIFTDLRF
jgi:hypothetical protein